MTEIYVRVGRHKPNHLYWVGVDEADDHDEIGVMFTGHFGQLMARALNHYLNSPTGNGEVLLGQREAQRLRNQASAITRITALNKTVICQALDPKIHRQCLGLALDMNNGLGCLCECHDNPRPTPDKDPPEEATA